MLVAPSDVPNFSGLDWHGRGVRTLSPTSRCDSHLRCDSIIADCHHLFGVILPIAQPTSEMLARGNPSLLDAGVALVSGLVAAYATARKGIPAALAGVAIAAALMPPICTVGLGIAFRNANLALGAGLLFLTNIIFIIFAEYAVLLWLGLRPQIEEGARNLTRLWWVIIGGMVITVVILFINLNASAFDEAAVEEQLAQAFAPAQIIEMDVISRDPLAVDVTLAL